MIIINKLTNHIDVKPNASEEKEEKKKYEKTENPKPKPNWNWMNKNKNKSIVIWFVRVSCEVNPSRHNVCVVCTAIGISFENTTNRYVPNAKQIWKKAEKKKRDPKHANVLYGISLCVVYEWWVELVIFSPLFYSTYNTVCYIVVHLKRCTKNIYHTKMLEHGAPSMAFGDSVFLMIVYIYVCLSGSDSP